MQARIWIGLFTILSLTGQSRGQGDHEDPLRVVLQRAGAYVVEFQREFGPVVAEERYVQIFKPWRRVPRSADEEPALQWTPAEGRNGGSVLASRRLRSDVLLMQMPDGIAIGYRDVFEVNGRPVRHHDERIKEIFLSGSPDNREQLRRIHAVSVRYNLGLSTRTVSTPSYPLVYLNPQVQSKVNFGWRGDQAAEATGCAWVEFRERVRPAIVATVQGSDVLAKGRFCIDAGTGRVHRAEVWFELNSTSRGMLQVTFEPEPGFDVLVPRQMWEWYQGALAGLPPPSASLPSGIGMGSPYLECLARYTNFRRFGVTTTEEVRIKD